MQRAQYPQRSTNPFECAPFFLPLWVSPCTAKSPNQRPAYTVTCQETFN